ncbi:BTAD domain-containing putative transcriptional regulator [Streptacidiphilus sp. EB129]|uniref:AfsR/SARP family transcriptional regulator n=1 Tax=Streptacidiphilus sp. EB129 TaxID=3156262 RepID=UPI0035166088
MDFRLLGPLEVRDDEGEPLRVPEGGARTLLAALLVHADTAVSGDSLAWYLWGSQPPRQPRQALQVTVTRLRKCLGPVGAERITRVGAGYRFAVRPGELDLHRFATLHQRGSAAHRAQDWPAAADLLRRALECWRGQPLDDVAGEPLALETVPALREQRFDALTGRIEADLALGRHGRLVGELARMVEDEPLREQFRCQLMLALYRSGRRAEALDAFQTGRRLLVGRLGIEPGAELRELHQAVLADDPGLAWSAPPSPAAARDAAPAAAGDRLRPAQLLADLPDFTGRTAAVERLEALLAKAATEPVGGPVVLSAIDGAGGMGKTSLAVHVAHRMLHYFPDGQLQIDLHGVGGAPADPDDVLARFLRGLGVPPDRIPADPEERGALYRSTLAGRRVLVLLDNVRDAAQVRPLLPGSGGCSVLITSRSSLPGLDGACRLTLDVLEQDEALALFTRIVGSDLADAEPEAVEAVLGVCAGLPLAIRIAAARLIARPGWTVKDLAERLGDERYRLSELTVEDRAVRACFAVSYRDLPADQARAFRLLGLCDGPSIGVPAAAALLALPVAATEQLLDALVGVHLLQPRENGHYRLHDLLRVYAAECAQAEEPQQERDAATGRMLGWYLHTSAAASRVLNPNRRHVVLDPPEADRPALEFADFDRALAWCESERANLVAAVAQAARAGRHEIAWKLPITMWDLFNLRSQHQDRIVCNEIALDGARATGDLEATAWVLNTLSSAYQAAGRLTEASGCLFQALEIRGRLGDLRGEGSCLINLGYVQIEMGRPAEAVPMLERALEIFRGLGVRAAEAVSLMNLGEAHKQLGNLTTALGHHREALAINRETADRFTLGRAMANVADTLCALGRFDEAAELAAEGHTTNQEAGNRVDEAIALDVLGQIHAARGEAAPAVRHWRDAHAILTELGHPRAVDVGARLADSPKPRPN